ncbi:unnamed protein product [Schistocephalus solidus]|uniref:Calponin-homology (CH) domain-containing protein n=1 Tax=Schistocephalus solidus TaxID=70667 RepID=A0A183SIP7_SCHSO|nr:unnamed protein product [Schistocephalus solidus]
MASDARSNLNRRVSRQPQKQHITFAPHAESAAKSSTGGMHPPPVSSVGADSTGEELSEEEDECRWRSETESLRNVNYSINSQALSVQIPKNDRQGISTIRQNKPVVSHWKRPPLDQHHNRESFQKPTEAAKIYKSEDKNVKRPNNGAGGMADGVRLKGFKRGGITAEVPHRIADAAWEKGPPNRLPQADEKQTLAAAEAARTAVRMMLESRYGNSNRNVLPPPKKRGEESVVWQPVDNSRNHFNPLTAMQGCKPAIKSQPDSTNSQSRKSSMAAQNAVDRRKSESTSEGLSELNCSGNSLFSNGGNRLLIAGSPFEGSPKAPVDDEVNLQSDRARFYSALSRFTNSETEKDQTFDGHGRTSQQIPEEPVVGSDDARHSPTQKARNMDFNRKHEVLRPKQVWRTKSIGRTGSDKNEDLRDGNHSFSALLFPKSTTGSSIATSKSASKVDFREKFTERNPTMQLVKNPLQCKEKSCKLLGLNSKKPMDKYSAASETVREKFPKSTVQKALRKLKDHFRKYTDEDIGLLEAKNIILRFCQLNTHEYIHQGVAVTNFSTSWADGTALCALVHHFFPTAFDFCRLENASKQEKIQLALSTAQ